MSSELPDLSASVARLDALYSSVYPRPWSADVCGAFTNHVAWENRDVGVRNIEKSGSPGSNYAIRHDGKFQSVDAVLLVDANEQPIAETDLLSNAGSRDGGPGSAGAGFGGWHRVQSGDVLDPIAPLPLGETPPGPTPPAPPQPPPLDSDERFQALLDDVAPVAAKLFSDVRVASDRDRITRFVQKALDSNLLLPPQKDFIREQAAIELRTWEELSPAERETLTALARQWMREFGDKWRGLAINANAAMLTLGLFVRWLTDEDVAYRVRLMHASDTRIAERFGIE